MRAAIGRSRTDSRTPLIRLGDNGGAAVPFTTIDNAPGTSVGASGESLGDTLILQCNLFPGEDFQKVEQWLIHSIANRPKASMLTHLSQRLPARTAEALLRHAGLDPAIDRESIFA